MDDLQVSDTGEYFKVIDTDESVLDFNEILKAELKNDNEQSFNTRWEETMIAMKKQPDGQILDNLNYRQLQQSEQLNPLLSLCIQDTVHKGESRDHTRLKDILWSDTWSGKFARSMSLLVKDNFKSHETRSRKETRIERQRKGFPTVQLSKKEFLGNRDTDRKKSISKGKPSQHASLCKRVLV